MGLNITLGQIVYVERKLGANRLKGAAKVIGAKSPRYLLLDMPMHDNSPVITTTGEKVIVRSMKEGLLVGFWAHSVKLFSEPFSMVILEYSPDVEEISVRQSERVGCNIPATMVFRAPVNIEKSPNAAVPANGSSAAQPPVPPLKTILVDLSKGGCLLAVPIHHWRYSMRRLLISEDSAQDIFSAETAQDQSVKGSQVDIHFDLPAPAESKSRSILSEVRWNKREGENVFLGLQFINPSSDVVVDIQKIIDHQREFFTRRFDIF